MAGSKNRRTGHKFETDLVKWYAETLNIIPFNGKNATCAQVGSTRQFSRSEDAKGIDIYFDPLLPQHITTLKIQAKKTLCNGVKTKSIDISSLLNMAADGLRILHTRIKRKAGKKEMKVADVVTMDMETFQTLIKAYVNENNPPRNRTTGTRVQGKKGDKPKHNQKGAKRSGKRS